MSNESNEVKPQETPETASEVTETQHETQQETEVAELKDKHGQPAISAAKYERDKKAYEEQIATLKAERAELEKEVKAFRDTEGAKEELEKKFEELGKRFDDRETDFKLELAGCKSVKAARALLPDFEGNIDKLKESAPYLFETRQAGTTGLKPSGATNEELARKNRARKAAGLPPLKE